jgi:2-methylcitrate dehydratase PrpD
MEEEPLAVRLADTAAAMSITALPTEVVGICKELIVDQLGLQVRGATLPNVAPVVRLVTAAGGTPECTVVGTGLRTSAPYAAYANGTFGHACQYDDSHQLAWHPGSCVLPSALAVAERERRTGADLITAVIAGTQVMAVLGAAATPAMQRLGWHGAKVLGVFGAAVGAGLMLGLPADTLAQAISIAASDAAGTMEYDHGGGEIKRLHAGSAARAGCEAALLARDGLTAPLTALDGTKGVLALIGRVDPAEARAAVGQAFGRFHVLEVIFRLHPTAGTVHAPLDGLAELRRKHDFHWTEIEEIRVGLTEYAKAHGGTVVRPHDVLSAQFSLAFSAGLLLTRGQDHPRDYFDPGSWHDPDILAVGDRVHVYATTFPDDFPPLSAHVHVRLNDGREFTTVQRGFRGHPANPATVAEIEAKFRGNLDGLRGREEADKILSLVRGLDQIQDLRRLAKLLAAPPGDEGSRHWLPPAVTGAEAGQPAMPRPVPDQ